MKCRGNYYNDKETFPKLNKKKKKNETAGTFFYFMFYFTLLFIECFVYFIEV